MHYYGYYNSLGVAQLRQLHGISNHLARQEADRQRQALLVQILFETEQVARSVAELARQDPFAAAIVGHMRARDVGSITPHLFHDLQAKHAWQHAIDGLLAPMRTILGDPSWAPLARRVASATDQLAALMADPGAFPGAEDELSRVGDEMAGAKASASRGQIVTIVGGVTLLAGICLGSVVVPGIVALMVMAGIGMGIGGWVTLHGALGRVNKAESRYGMLSSAAFRKQAFEQNPEGGLLLSEVAARHPALR